MKNLWFFSHEKIAHLETGESSQSGRGRMGRRGYPALPILSEKQGHVFAIIPHLPQRSYYRATRGKEKPKATTNIKACLVIPQNQTMMAQTWHCCCWQAEIPAHSVPALCHNMPFPSTWEKTSLQQMVNIPQTGHWKKTSGANKREGKLHTQKRGHGSLSCAP